MAFPPVIPPNTRQNITPELDNHPSDHNVISNALATLTAMLTNAARGFVQVTTAFSGSAGSGGLVVATMNVPLKAGRKYEIRGLVTGHNATANANQGVFPRDGTSAFYDAITTGGVANSYLTVPIYGLLDCGATDRVAVINAYAYAGTGAYVMDRGTMAVYDVGATTPVAVP